LLQQLPCLLRKGILRHSNDYDIVLGNGSLYFLDDIGVIAGNHLSNCRVHMCFVKNAATHACLPGQKLPCAGNIIIDGGAKF